MNSHIADDLADRIDLVAASVALAGTEEESTAHDLFVRIARLQKRIGERDETPFRRFAMRLSLTESEQQVVMLLVAMRARADVRATIRQAVATMELSVDAIRSLIYGTLPSRSAHEELASTGTLRRLAIIERNDECGPNAHESKQTWAVAPRVLTMLHGGEEIDTALARVCRTREVAGIDVVATSAEAIECARSAVKSDAIVIASGMPGVGRRTLLAAAAHEVGRRVIEIDARRLAKDPTTLGQQLRAIARECRLLARTPLLVNFDGDDERMDAIGCDLVGSVEGPFLVTTGVSRPRLDWGRPVIVVEMQHPTTAQRSALWRRALGEITEQDVEHLSTHYPLAPGLIARAADAAKARANGRRLQANDVYAGIRAVLDDRIGQFAKRVTVTQSWDDLVLPHDQTQSIIELIARIRERRRVYEEWGFAKKIGKGLGVSALFSGPPGTGKTMVAALIAQDLNLELYQVDLGKVVSKYVGETEKNLAALFDAAETGHAVLLFDEADALFGKRTDVKSSNDRYANLETNYLLQRLESFTGICLLTSNHETNIDSAFLRRLSMHIRFDLPDAEERAHLWGAMLPKAAPVDDGVDLESLARRFAMSGGYIRNAALRAAFLAADEDTRITARHLERAARSEYEAMGKIAPS